MFRKEFSKHSLCCFKIKEGMIMGQGVTLSHALNRLSQKGSGRTKEGEGDYSLTLREIVLLSLGDL